MFQQSLALRNKGENRGRLIQYTCSAHEYSRPRILIGLSSVSSTTLFTRICNTQWVSAW